MFNWKTADESDKSLLKSIKFLLLGRDKLLEFMFNPHFPRLNDQPENLLHSSLSFSSGEQLLVRIALDLWDGSGGAHFRDIYSILDRETYVRAIQVIEKIRWNTSYNSVFSAPIKMQHDKHLVRAN
jgi:hypothetical protein